MVRIASVVAFVTLIVSSVIALPSGDTSSCSYCQCLFSDASHCCMYHDPEGNSVDCNQVCASAHRADGTSNSDGTGGTPCNAGGSSQCISAITAQLRDGCYAQS